MRQCEGSSRTSKSSVVVRVHSKAVARSRFWCETGLKSVNGRFYVSRAPPPYVNIRVSCACIYFIRVRARAGGTVVVSAHVYACLRARVRNNDFSDVALTRIAHTHRINARTTIKKTWLFTTVLRRILAVMVRVRAVFATTAYGSKRVGERKKNRNRKRTRV